jgi:hypothetical protein
VFYEDYSNTIIDELFQTGYLNQTLNLKKIAGERLWWKMFDVKFRRLR